jgi:hypothetical protein
VSGDGRASVTWQAPASDGGSPILSYRAQGWANGSPVIGASCTLASPFTEPLTCTITGLTNGTAYTFTVLATNASGESAMSDATAAVTPDPPATVPGAPQNVTATAGDGQASVTWQQPVSDGGSTITSYTVQASADGAALAGASCTLSTPFSSPLTCTIGGLTNGTAVTFVVTATNAVGAGAPSAASIAVTPQAATVVTRVVTAFVISPQLEDGSVAYTGSLAYTGTNVLGALIVAGLLLGAGSLALLGARRRKVGG